jgi:hypothetical protein
MTEIISSNTWGLGADFKSLQAVTKG